MKKFLASVPLPICGVMLGLAALGNLLQAVFTNVLGSAAAGDALRYVCGAAASVIWIVVVLKVIVCFAGVKKAMEDPVVASVSGTFPMATMLLAAYAKPFIGGAAQIIWFAAIALHAVLILWFTCKFILHFDLQKVFASYYIVYVGIAVAAVSAPAFGQLAVGAATFWFGIVTFVILLVVVTMRYAKHPVKEPARPLFCIYAAPVSLCLAGYIQSVTPKSAGVVIGLLAVSTAIYVVVLCRLPSLLKLKFYPSYAAFTFPFAITAIAAMQSMACLKNLERPQPWLKYVVLVETALAAILVVYALVRYIQALAAAQKAEQKQ